jgi:hypothetical protein
MPEITSRKYKCKKCGEAFLSRAKEPRCLSRNAVYIPSYFNNDSKGWVFIKCGSRRVESVPVAFYRVADVVEYIPGPPPNPNAASLIGFHKWLDTMKLEVHTSPKQKVDHYMKYLDSIRKQ